MKRTILGTAFLISGLFSDLVFNNFIVMKACALTGSVLILSIGFPIIIDIFKKKPKEV